jgi:hypothetical protein
MQLADPELQKELDQYDEKHLGEQAKGFFVLMRDTIVHEVGHGVGIQHHKPENAGEPRCFMCLPSVHLTPADPYEIKVPLPFSLFCRDPKYAATPKGCWGQIVISDRDPKCVPIK